MIVQALDSATPTLRELAREVGISYGAVRMYRAGQRTPSPKVVRALLKTLRRRSAQLAKLADNLEVTAKSQSRVGRKKE